MDDRYYYVKDSDETDMQMSSSYVEATIYPSHIEGVGVSYARHYKTIPELEKEIEELKNKPYSQEEYDKRLAELQCLLDLRRKPHKPRTMKSKVRTDNIQSFNRSKKLLTSYLYANFDVPFALAATITYKNKVYDMKIAREDFKKFAKKFTRKFKNSVWIAIYEFHEDGSVHIHFVFKNARGATHDVLTKMWGHGLVYVKQMDSKALAYFCKSERLEMYPSGTRLFSKSNNCKKPRKIKMSVEQFNTLTKDMDCTYTKARTLYMASAIRENGKRVNHYIYKNFKKRKED